MWALHLAAKRDGDWNTTKTRSQSISWCFCFMNHEVSSSVLLWLNFSTQNGNWTIFKDEFWDCARKENSLIDDATKLSTLKRKYFGSTSSSCSFWDAPIILSTCTFYLRQSFMLCPRLLPHLWLSNEKLQLCRCFPRNLSVSLPLSTSADVLQQKKSSV